MKKTFKQQLVTRVMTCSTLLALAGGVVSPLLANGPLVSAVTSTNPVGDKTSARSITITKYQSTELNDHGAAGDGTLASVSNALLQGVDFKIERVTPVSGGAQLTDPTVQKLGTDYTIDTSFTAQTVTTNASGQAVFNLGTGTTNDGLYLVTEVNDTNAIDPATGKPVKVTTPSKPFFVFVPQTLRGTQAGLIYDVQAQPKNVIENALNPVKTINNKAGDSVLAGQAFEWEMTTNLPSGLYSLAKTDTQVAVVDAAGNQLYNADKTPAYVTVKAGSPLFVPAGSYFDAAGAAATSVAVSNFMMHDTLNAGLNYVGATVWAHNATGWVELSASDYAVSNSSGEFKMTLTEQGIKELGSGTVTDVKGATVTGPFDQISTHLQTTVNPGFNGYIPNTFDVTYQTPGGKPITQTPPPGTPGSEPKYYTGGLDVLKQDEATKAQLSGAEFKIATSQANAEQGLFLASDGKSYGPTDTLPAGVTYLTSTSDSAGHAAFDGLPLVWTDGNGDGIVNIDPATGLPINGDTIQQNYWVVETKAPAGYELLKTAQEVIVTLDTAKDANTELTVNDKKATDLPFTGGAGTVLMVTIALGAIGVGTAMIVINKKRQANEA